MRTNTNSTRLNNLSKINSVLDHIEQNLENDLSLNTLAEVAYFSPFHFHRIFTTVMGETLHEFVTRKRLEKIASFIMKSNHSSIKELSLKYGFDNSSSFSRAFKNYYGISATTLRNRSKVRVNKLVKEKSKIGKETLSLKKYIYNVDKVRAWMKSKTTVELKIMQEQKLAYVRNRGSFDKVLGAFKKLKLWAQHQNLLNVKNVKWLMVIHDNPAITEESKMIQSACIRLDKDSDTQGEIGRMNIPKGAYLIGHFEILDHEFKKAWDGMSIWMMDNGHTSRDGHFFELFHTNSLFKEGEKHSVDICIPVE